MSALNVDQDLLDPTLLTEIHTDVQIVTNSERRFPMLAAHHAAMVNFTRLCIATWLIRA